jgi:adenosylmethionine-8-amino-7-oxononanoate aminotransferase
MLDSLRDIAIVGDVRGAGYFHAIELVKDPETRTRFDAKEASALIHGFLAPKIFDSGLHCRCDDRGTAVIQLAPPLIAGPPEFAEMEQILRPALEEAAQRFPSRGARGGSNHAAL